MSVYTGGGLPHGGGSLSAVYGQKPPEISCHASP